MTSTRVPARIAAGIGAFAMFAWGVWCMRAGFERQQWFDLPEEDPSAFLALEGSAPEPLVHVQRADLVSEGLFPPDHDRAVDDVRMALVMDPQFSRGWMTLARERIFQGRQAEAREALMASDRLSPLYPSERLKSAALWRMLGDDDRALVLARRIASLGSDQTGPVARELLRLGFETDVVLDVVRFPELETIDRLSLLKVFHRERPGSARVLIDRLPPEDLEYQEVRQYVAPFLMRPLDAPLLAELWNISSPGLRLIDGHIWAEDLRLEQSPFIRQFPMGWLKLEGSEATVSWEQPTGSVLGGNAGGRIRFSLPRYVRGELRWPCYRLLADIGPPFDVEIAMTPALTRTSEVGFGGTMSPGNALEGTVERVIGERGFSMRLRVPERTEPSLVTLQVSWKPLVDPTAAQGDAIFVDELRILLKDGSIPQATSPRIDTPAAPSDGLPEPAGEIPDLPLPPEELE